jgi:predicted nucleotidyltransferase
LEVSTEKVLKELRSRVEKDLGDRLVRIVLFGSRAREDFDFESDIDIAMTSVTFQGNSNIRYSIPWLK